MVSTVAACAAEGECGLGRAADTSGGGKPQVELSVREGRNRIVRRMMAAAGMPIKQLHRTHVGPLCLHQLQLPRPTDATRVPDDDMTALWAALGGDHLWVSPSLKCEIVDRGVWV